MHECFKNNKERIAFIVLLLFVLFSPFLTYFIDRPIAYRSVSLRCGPYAYIADEIFNKTEAIDMLFLSSSEIWTGVNIKHLRKLWKSKHHKDFNIVMLGSNWRGMDRFYFILKDVLKRRRVKTLVLSIYGRTTFPYYGSKHLFSIFEHRKDFNGMSLKNYLLFYAQSIWGMPRLIYEWLVPNKIPVDCINGHATNYGFLEQNLGYDPLSPKAELFKKRDDKPPIFGSHEVTYWGGGSKIFPKPPPLEDNNFELHFYEKIVSICKKYNIKIALIQIPLPTDQGDTITFAQESRHKEIPIIGMPLHMLFPNMSLDAIKGFYYNNNHLNSNGARYFTESISDVLYDFYEGKNGFYR
jgi:hypothetical protein